MKKQQGLSMISFLFVSALVVMGALLLIKIIPVYTEYYSARTVLKRVASEVGPTAPPAQYRASFEKFSIINDMPSIQPEMIIVTRDPMGVLLTTSYQREVKLFGNVSLLFRFKVSS